MHPPPRRLGRANDWACLDDSLPDLGARIVQRGNHQGDGNQLQLGVDISPPNLSRYRHLLSSSTKDVFLSVAQARDQPADDVVR